MKRTFLAICLSSVVSFAVAHSPFVAPMSYLVNGGHTGILAGFAEQPFDSEVAIKGFDFKVIYPEGEEETLTLTNSKTLSIADIDTAQKGTYQVVGSREGELKYVKLGQRWLRVLDAKSDSVPPLVERQFAVQSEVTDKTPQTLVKRYDQVGSYFTKKEATALQSIVSNHGLTMTFSSHPNQISLQKPVTLKLSLNHQPAVGYQVELEQQPTNGGEQSEAVKLMTNQKGEVVLPFSGVGQYIVTVTSPEQKQTLKPTAETYRSIVSLYVNP